MEKLQALFPPHDFALLALIIGLPLVGAFVNGVFGKRLGKQAVSLMALFAVGASFLASVATFALLAQAGGVSPDAHGHAEGHADHGEGHGPEAALVRFSWTAWHWFSVSGRFDSAPIPIDIGFSVDALSGTMALVVTGVGFLIHLYSTAYMAEDPGFHRFFAYLNLFIFSMLVLILGDSLPVLFIGWEGVGLCSYLLIGFWFEETANAAAGKKAFIANRIGDFGLLVGMGILVWYVGRLDWEGIETNRQLLLSTIKVWPLGDAVPLASLLPDGAEQWINKPRYVSAATMCCLALFLGCAGKSAQIPLYVWLPDAMAGPTPVSALIHAATMVTAGVYLVCRMAGVFLLSPAAMFTIAVIGVLTALLAASIALVQNDIKKVLAYSTVSQLGYMFLGVGVGAFTAGFFHVITHAFFKACLFLGAGSVIHAMHARIHDTNASQDMRNMGGLYKYMPHTHWTFLVSCLAIAGLPFTSGFFSKDEIIFKAYTSSVLSPTENGRIGGPGGITIESFQWPAWGGTFLLTGAVLGAVLTAFYMFRLYFRTFWGDFKGWNIVAGWKSAHGHHDAHGHDEHHGDEPIEGPKPHESPLPMTVPLMVLGALAVVAGFLNPHAFLHLHPFDDWLRPVFRTAMGLEGRTLVGELENAKTLATILLVPGILAFVVGTGAAYWVYVVQKGEPAAKLASSAAGVHRFLFNKWYVDELYQETVIGAVDSLADFCTWFDKWVVDGIIARFSAFVVMVTGMLLRLAQTGRVQSYATAMVIGLGVLGWYVLVPHASAQAFADHSAGTYSVVAAPGLGYQYRWDRDGDGQLDGDFAEARTVQFALDRNQARKVKLEVRNAFGRVAEREFSFERPPQDASAPVLLEQGADGQLRQRQPRTRPTAPAGDSNHPGH